MTSSYAHLLNMQPPGVDVAGDFRWALALLAEINAVSYAAVATVARRSRRLIGYDGCPYQDVRNEVTAVMARGRGEAGPCGCGRRAASEGEGSAQPEPSRIGELRRRLRVADSRNAEEVAKALDADRKRLRAERRLARMRTSLSGADALED